MKNAINLACSSLFYYVFWLLFSGYDISDKKYFSLTAKSIAFHWTNVLKFHIHPPPPKHTSQLTNFHTELEQ